MFENNPSMAYKKKEIKAKPGPKPKQEHEKGKAYRVWLTPPIAEYLQGKYATLTQAILHLNALELKKDKKITVSKF